MYDNLTLELILELIQEFFEDMLKTIPFRVVLIGNTLPLIFLPQIPGGEL